MEYSPTLCVEAVLPSCFIQPCFENFLGFRSQVWSITLLLPERVLPTPPAKIVIIIETSKELRNYFLFEDATSAASAAEWVLGCGAQGCGSPYSFRLAKNSSRDFFVFNITNITNAASCCRSMRFGGDIMVILVILLGCF